MIKTFHDLRDEHMILMSGKTPNWRRVKALLHQGPRIGKRLWAGEHRRAAQSLLDYWAAKAIRAHQMTNPAAFLDSFDILTPGSFLPRAKVKADGIAVELWDDEPGEPYVKLRQLGRDLALRCRDVPALIRALQQIGGIKWG